MKNIYSVIITIFCVIIIACNSQQKIYKISVNESLGSLNESIKMREWLYPKYNNKVVTVLTKDTYTYYYNYDTLSYNLNVSNKYSDYLLLFEKGILHPKLISCIRGNIITIGQFNESINPNKESVRRYKFWSWCNGSMNPCEYTIELLNKQASIQSTTKDFIENAVIIYISQCNVII